MGAKKGFKELVRLMVDHDLELARQEKATQQIKGALLPKRRWGAA